METGTEKDGRRDPDFETGSGLEGGAFGRIKEKVGNNGLERVLGGHDTGIEEPAGITGTNREMGKWERDD